MAVDAMNTFSGIKKEVDTIVRLRIDKVINKMKLVKREEFEILKLMVKDLSLKNRELEKKIKQIKRKRAKKPK